jgi:muconolactone D-isomerase
VLFHVQMTVNLPHDLEADRVELLKAEERSRALDLQREGKWRHLWRIAGRYANISIFEVESSDELHEILSTLPLFPFMAVEVEALCRHPSALATEAQKIRAGAE